MAHISDFVENGADVVMTDDGRGSYRYLSAGEILQLSQAISLKRIADALSGDAFLSNLSATLADASHDHAQRMS